MATELKRTAIRAKYLSNASEALIATSPAIAAHLRMVRQSIDWEEDAASPSCAACGNFLIPGWSCNSMTGGRGRQTRKDRSGKATAPTTALKLQCSKCNAINLVDRHMKTVKTRAETATVLKPPANEQETPKPALATHSRGSAASSLTTNDASKRRTRGKKATLQSMLAQQKTAVTDTKKGFGLDLADLMKI